MGNYKKIVRDQVPGKLRTGGLKVVTRTVHGKELQKALRARLDEELAEYDAATDDEHAVGALVDMLEIAAAMAAQWGYSEARLQQTRESIKAQQGAFELGIFLVSAE